VKTLINFEEFLQGSGHDYYLRKHATGKSLRRAALRQTPRCRRRLPQHDHRDDFLFVTDRLTQRGTVSAIVPGPADCRIL
jgi:hypothetical protein